MNAADKFSSWLGSYSMQRLVYHTGFLMRDRLGDAEVEKLGRLAWAAKARGKVLLIQRRVAEGVYEYRAVKRRRGL